MTNCASFVLWLLYFDCDLMPFDNVSLADHARLSPSKTRRALLPVNVHYDDQLLRAQPGDVRTTGFGLF